VATVLLGWTTVAAAQMELAVFQGTITDEAGAPLEGVTIRLRDLERGRETVLKSDKNGRFYRRGMAAVEYEMVVEKDGYQPINDKVRLVTGNEPPRLDFKLAKSAPAGAGEFARRRLNAGRLRARMMFEAASWRLPKCGSTRTRLPALNRPADAACADSGCRRQTRAHSSWAALRRHETARQAVTALRRASPGSQIRAHVVGARSRSARAGGDRQGRHFEKALVVVQTPRLDARPRQGIRAGTCRRRWTVRQCRPLARRRSGRDVQLRCQEEVEL
jgi:hypothetical protein